MKTAIKVNITATAAQATRGTFKKVEAGSTVTVIAEASELTRFSLTDLARLHNSVVDADSTVKRFSDKKSAARRTFEALETLPEPKEKGARSKPSEHQVVTLCQPLDEEIKLPKQARCILATLQSLKADEEVVLRSDVIKAMPEFVKTCQPMERIFAFYRKTLEDAGCILIEAKKEEV